jgi:hypothetical protein
LKTYFSAKFFNVIKNKRNIFVLEDIMNLFRNFNEFKMMKLNHAFPENIKEFSAKVLN